LAAQLNNRIRSSLSTGFVHFRNVNTNTPFEDFRYHEKLVMQGREEGTVLEVTISPPNSGDVEDWLLVAVFQGSLTIPEYVPTLPTWGT
jgi:hypothetical protein